MTTDPCWRSECRTGCYYQETCDRRPAMTTDPTTQDVDRVARLLIAEWERVEGKPVTVSYVATFADMARVALADSAACVAAARAEAWDEGWAARYEYDNRRDVPIDWPDHNPHRAVMSREPGEGDKT